MDADGRALHEAPCPRRLCRAQQALGAVAIDRHEFLGRAVAAVHGGDVDDCCRAGDEPVDRRHVGEIPDHRLARHGRIGPAQQASHAKAGVPKTPGDRTAQQAAGAGQRDQVGWGDRDHVVAIHSPGGSPRPASGPIRSSAASASERAVVSFVPSSVNRPRGPPCFA